MLTFKGSSYFRRCCMIYNKEAPSSIQLLFDDIAGRYDLANSLLSFHMYAAWNKKMAKSVLSRTRAPCENIIDLCAGTGDIARRLLDYTKSHPPHIHLAPHIHL